MTTLSVITKLHRDFGGTVGKKHRTTDKYLQQYLWLVSGKRAYKVLKVLEPYLVGKTEQCRLGIEYFTRVSQAPRVGYRLTEHTEETRKYQEWAWKRMKELKLDGGR